MPDAKKNTPPCPAQWVGGQRRKLVRRNRSNAGPPRSSTMPVLNPGSATASLVSSISSAGSTYAKDRQSEDSFDRYMQSTIQESEETDDTMQFYPPAGAVKPTYTALTDGPTASSPRLAATDHKKKQGLFGSKKSKPAALERPKTSPSTSSLVTSPLPVSTPSKAAKFFGLEAKSSVANSPCRVELGDKAAASDNEAPEEDVQTDEPPKATKSSAAKGLKMLIPELAGPKRSPIEQTKTAATRFEIEDEEDDVGYASDGHQEARFRIPAAPRPVRTASKSKPMRRKPLTLKDFPRMSPITEASIESLRPAYREGEEVTELGVISEYEYEDPPQNAPMPPRSQAETTFPPHDKFELEEEDLSPTDEYYDDEEATDEEEDVVHPGTKVKVNAKRVHWQKAIALSLRSPLQTAEDNWLDATEEEMRLETHKMTLDRVDAERKAMDDKVAEMKSKHEQFKLDFTKYSTEYNPSGSIRAKSEPVPDEESEDEDADLVSLRSSIDLEEEPTVHEAKLMTFIRITPGMVKLVDIPPRKKKPVASAESRVPVFDKPTLVGHQKKTTATSARSENVSPPPSPVVTHYHHEDPDCSAKSKKSKLTRDESRLLVQNWVSDYNSTEQRPLSTRVDPDVLADQETPPAPFPKGDESLPTPPAIKPRFDSLKPPQHLLKHQCINNGHIFHPVDLKIVPDTAIFNSLEVRPYLQTYTGVKQHVKIPVMCEKCGEDCDENLWECEIAVCRMIACQNCAEDMEAEWQQRAVNGWKYK
ncbi:hypothetical protein E8E11_004263 [Didymella keratinophila]|nr:hypothetical protein E8E11_004263 [Didymella keratinophila]